MDKDKDAYDQQYVKTHLAKPVPITLQDELVQYGALQVDKTDLWEETAYALVAESGDYDVLLWTAGYILKSNGRGVWIDKDAVEHDILMIAVPKSSRGKMSDNNFVRAGWHQTERLPADALKVEQHEDKVVWDFAGHQFISRPPQWDAKGHYAGVDLDLTFTQKNQPIWNWGPFKDVAKTERAGYDVFASVDGTLKTAGRTFDIKNGYGVREHILVGNPIDPVRNLPAPRIMYWLYVMKDDIGINFFRPGAVDIGSVYAGDHEVKFNPAGGKGSINYQTLEHWHDPRSGMNLPVRWHLNMTSDDCTVDLEISSHGRAYEFWTGDAGMRMYTYFVCVANGFVSFPDGRKVEFKDHIALNSNNQTILVKKETLDGAVYD